MPAPAHVCRPKLPFRVRPDGNLPRVAVGPGHLHFMDGVVAVQRDVPAARVGQLFDALAVERRPDALPPSGLGGVELPLGVGEVHVRRFGGAAARLDSRRRRRDECRGILQQECRGGAAPHRSLLARCSSKCMNSWRRLRQR